MYEVKDYFDYFYFLDEDTPRFLTCNNAELLTDGTPVFAVAVTVSDKSGLDFGGMVRTLCLSFSLLLTFPQQGL